ncbi:polyprenyl synthetase family protein [Serratia marcescens]|uniref:Polyprenyl synthetase family protein n=1 Tax=Serratia marcescens TaxID=615 RepID=A0A939SR18_SERMA|nr:polyprenyl synthetase family protein [Serratia marcescens]
MVAAMRHGALLGGKRLRRSRCTPPARCSACRWPTRRAGGGGGMHSRLPLIHDDPPAMDDDDLRRGQPTCHIKFGEANAIPPAMRCKRWRFRSRRCRNA